MVQYDVCIIGGGPGGTQAARTLAAGGKRVVMVENTQWGGTCLNRGCIPTKLLLGATAPVHALHAHTRYKTVAGTALVNYPALQARVNRFLAGTRQTLQKNLEGMGITLVQGVAHCTGRQGDASTVTVAGPNGNETLTATTVILAGGSRTAAFSGLTPDHDCVLDSTDMLQLPEVPESLIVIGAGAIGVELSDFFATLGTKVTLVEGAPQAVPTEDADIAKELGKAITASGRTLLTGAKAASLRTHNRVAVLVLQDGTELTATKALVAVGRTPNTQKLGCEALGCALNPRGFIETNSTLQAAPQVYAIGDINGRTLLAHAAEHQGDYVARHILGEEAGEYVPGPMPSCVYGSTEVMRVGATARELAAQGQAVLVSQAPLSSNSIAQAHASTAGFVKAVWANGTLCGMGAVGHGVSHLVTAAQLLVHGKYTPHSLHSFMFAHPTLDEALRTALLAPQMPFTE